MIRSSKSKRRLFSLLKKVRFVFIGFWLVVVVLLPLVWIFLTSIKPTEDTLSSTPVLFFTPTLQNYEFGASIIDPYTHEPVFAGIASQLLVCY